VPTTTVGHQARWVIRQHRRSTGSGRRYEALLRRWRTRPLAIHLHPRRNAQDSLAPSGPQPATRPSVISGGALRDTLACAAAFGARRNSTGPALGCRALSRGWRAVPLTQVASCGDHGGACSAMVISPFEDFACPTPDAVTALTPDCRQGAVQERPRKRNGRRLRGAREVKLLTALASLENNIGGGFAQSYDLRRASDANGRAQRRFRLRPVKEKPQRC
jgi:hypothetical protein